MTVIETGNVRVEEYALKHCCPVKAISITYSECTYIALGI